MAESTPRREARAALSGAGVAGLAGCSGVTGSTRSPNGTVVQLVADSGAAEAQADINEALHEAGLSAESGEALVHGPTRDIDDGSLDAASNEERDAAVARVRRGYLGKTKSVAVAR